MRRSIFLDTNGWLMLLNAAETLHSQALGIWLEVLRDAGDVVLTDWIIAETGNGMARSRKKNRFGSVVEAMLVAPSVELVVIERELLGRALANYAQHADKSWGLVDCASFIVMRDRGISDAFTSDRHFEQAGFTCLLSAG